MKNAIFFVLCIFLLTGCNPAVSLKPAELAKALDKQGWTYNDLPRELLGPGTIVTLSASRGVTYRGHISDCINDESVTAAIPGNAKIP